MDLVFIAGVVITLVTAVPVILQLRRHPRGLVILFFAEMWERFSYYGMRGLLIFYLTQQFLFDDKTASAQYGAYTSLVYLLPLVGGFLADRFLGTRKAVAFGALLLVAGHLTMAIEGKPAVQTLTYGGAQYEFQVTGRANARDVKLKVGDAAYAYSATADGGLAIQGLPAAAPLPSVLPQGSYELGVKGQASIFKDVLFLALALIIMGVGFLKANISSIVGQLYPEGDPRRDPGFTLYYYGINLGSFWAAIACGALGQTVGWWAGFGAAGVGMLLGLVVFVLGKPLLEGKGEPPDPARLKKPLLGPLNLEWTIYLAALAGVAVVWFVVQHNDLVGGLLGAGAIVTLGYLFWFMSRIDKVHRERMMLALVLILGSVVFWALYEQGGSSLNQFAERNVDLSIGFGQSMTPAQAQSFQASWILILAPVISWIWAWLGARGRDPNPALKFSLGLLLVGGSYFVIVGAAGLAGAPDHRIPLFWLAAAYLAQTTGELCLSPVGLSQMTKLAPPSVVATMMATWFLGTSGAQWLAGQIAAMTAADTVAGQVLDPGKSLATYVDVFTKLGIGGVAAGVVMLALSPILKRWVHGADEARPQQPEPTAPVADGERQAVNPAAARADRGA
jgi:POT family proton-dependent oligopeptide transporter